MSSTLLRLRGLLSQDFVNAADTGVYLDGAGLWLVITERGRRYELRDGADPQYVGEAGTMTLDHARRTALEMREARELGANRMPYRNALRPVDLHRFVNEWTRNSLAAAAE
ncbi:Arm DNA-binding domain-containing protein [Paraburkholderia rhynchosiae]|uniref:Uncharacterized protein n=1 Tax=Paraburkholderia rhynchosiae TaxID=487049 RepID=A0A2N7WD11_9BURK|nr:Arm DNA-binding domain-containing protein [Paraburkholderia rhynchosiae]PMS27310.1 hypothetical protein C0Z16_25120 [Paraburkholderia rhynchosiae]CAB3744299.1 hypothetical protein LMG27174_07152 [Paraburkholderia rhynchosiae]